MLKEVTLPIFDIDKVDIVFALAFVVVVVGAVLMFVATQAVIVIASMVGMFLGFAAMLLCLGLEFD
ncbi:MAG: hypothetical protein U5J64_12555 [Halobacteriales archaeon]|nr:hypothetical protein [Halobacteriales archaeon]